MREKQPMKEDNVIVEKSKKFGVRTIRLYKYMSEMKKEYTLSKQILRSGTSIGANVHEAVYGQSREDFISKLSIALKEAHETEYWLELLRETEYIDEKQYESMIEDCIELKKILTSIIKKTKEK